MGEVLRSPEYTEKTINWFYSTLVGAALAAKVYSNLTIFRG